MAERNLKSVLSESKESEQALRSDEVAKKKRNFQTKAGDRSRKSQFKLSKRRACTPEPGLKAWTDESEKDVSDGESAAQHSKPGAKGDGKPSPAPRTRILQRSKEMGINARRTRSAERAPIDGADGDEEEDFEAIRSMHKSKELEEDMSEKLLGESSKVKVNEELKIPVQREMPPLIVSSADLRKRNRHKSVPFQEHSCEKVAQKPSLLNKGTQRKLSTSEEEENDGRADPGNRGKHVLKATKPKMSSSESEKVHRKLKRVLRRDKSEASESEGRSSERTQDEEDGSDIGSEATTKDCALTRPPADVASPESRLTLFMSWFSWRKKSKDVAPVLEEDSEKNCEVTRKVSDCVKECGREDEAETQTAREEGYGKKRKWFLVEAAHMWQLHIDRHTLEYRKIICLKNKCMSQLLLVLMYCGFGGMIFRFIEGTFESFYKCGVKRVKRDFIDSLWSYSQYMMEEDWKSQARRKLMEFENQLHTAHEAGMTTYSGQRSWSFLNSVVYCLTVITTIGYGHISPSTTTGRAITIIYAIFGIPLFLILLADFGKLFTRGIKFLWAFVRRLYYTGSCKKVRKTAPVQEMMKGVQLVYGFAKNRRPSQWGIDQQSQHQQHLNQLQAPEGNLPETPGTPNLSAFEIDDEFNLPISVAITILLIYIFFGATIYWSWEEWSFFESFYFVFISMSTIGFGDFVPQNPVYMMASIIYLVFGLALTSMCINVVQEKLTDTFRQASTKIGATIGLRVAEDGTISAPPELADVNPIQNLK